MQRGVGEFTIQGQVRPGIVVVLEIPSQDATQMGLVEHDDMIQTSAAYRTDDSFAIRILPRRPWGNQDSFGAHALDAFLDIFAIDAIAVAYKKT